MTLKRRSPIVWTCIERGQNQLVDFYKKRGSLRVVDAGGAIDEVYSRLLEQCQ